MMPAASSFCTRREQGEGRQAHGFRQLLVSEPAVMLQGFQDAQVSAVQFCQFLLAHDDFSLYLLPWRNIIANKAVFR